MIKITVTSNTDEVMRQARRIAADQMPFATAKALTLTGKASQAAVVEEIGKVFDRPISKTRNGTFVKPATKQSLVATLWIKDDFFTGTEVDKYLRPEIEGGKRRHKRFELALIAAGLMPSDLYAVPGARIKLDRFGNINPGLIVQILSALGAAERTSGYAANRTQRSRNRKPKRVEYFVGRPGNGAGPLGIWQKIGAGARPIIIFVKQPTYKKRLDFYAVAGRVAAARFLPIFVQAFDDAVKTSRAS